MVNEPHATAQASVVESALTLRSAADLTSDELGVRLGTRDHAAPSQRRLRVWSDFTPTAHASVDDVADASSK